MKNIEPTTIWQPPNIAVTPVTNIVRRLPGRQVSPTTIIQDDTSKTRQDKPLPPLTPKQAKMVQHIVRDGMTKTDAYKAAYNTKGNNSTVYAEASKTTNKPQVKLELAKYSGEAEKAMLNMMNTGVRYAEEGGKEGAAYASVAVAAAKDILDRVHGKATQRVEATSQAVTIHIDLTGQA